MDEIFGRNNYLNTIIVKAKAVAGASGGGEDKRLKKNYEFILVYAKNYEEIEYKQPLSRVNLMDYINDHKENNVGFYYTRIIKDYGIKNYICSVNDGAGDEIKVYEHYNFEFSSVSKLARTDGVPVEEIYKKYFDDIFMVTNAQTSILTRVNEVTPSKKSLISFEYVPKTGKDRKSVV